MYNFHLCIEQRQHISTLKIRNLYQIQKEIEMEMVGLSFKIQTSLQILLKILLINTLKNLNLFLILLIGLIRKSFKRRKEIKNSSHKQHLSLITSFLKPSRKIVYLMAVIDRLRQKNKRKQKILIMCMIQIGNLPILEKKYYFSLI